MGEMDLNALRAAAQEKMQPKFKEEQIAELQQQIARLEAKIGGPSEADKFRALSPREPKARLQDLNSTLSEEEKYTAESYIAELADTGGPSLSNMRLQMARQKLESLLKPG